MVVQGRQKKFNKRSRLPSQENFFWYKLLIGFILLFSIACFLHFREFRIQVLEVNRIAKGYVVAQVDFEFPDPDATMVLRQEAFRDIGRIYKINEKEILRVRHKFENYLIHHPNWRKGNESTFEEMYNALDAVTNALSLANLTDSRTLKKREELNLPTDNYYIMTNLDSDHLNTLSDAFWDELKETVYKESRVSENSLNFVIDYFKGSKWKVTTDIDSQRIFQQMIELEVPERYTRVRAGNRIIDQGDKVTQRHIAMLNAMKKEIRNSKEIWTVSSILGSLLFSLLIVGALFTYAYFRQKALLNSIRQLSLYTTIFVLTLIFAKVVELILLYAGTQWIDYVHYPIFVPFATILYCILLNEEIALVSTFLLTTLIGLTLVFDHNHIIFINLIAGVIALVTSQRLKKRKEVFTVSVKIWIASFFVIFAFNITMHTLFSSEFLIDIIASASNLIIISILLVGVMPALEGIFNVMTDMTLMEFMDPTNELLKRLSIEAPGTYQHSLSIGHIAEYVANSIGANGLFCRVTTLYHDIGKLNTPHHYTENQLLGGGKTFNIHHLLTPIESAYIIKSHIPDGVALAKQHRLPQPFIDVIQQHHGTTLIKYFYIKQLEEMKGNRDDVDENAFRYPGPKPQTKEAAIIMLSDSTEAASRTLEDNSEESIRKMIDAITADKINDGQLDNCPLTFKELHTIKTKLVEMIKATHHVRIKYPKANPAPSPKAT